MIHNLKFIVGLILSINSHFIFSQGWERILNVFPDVKPGNFSLLFPTKDDGVISCNMNQYPNSPDSLISAIVKLDKYGNNVFYYVLPDSLSRNQSSKGRGFTTFADDSVNIYFTHWSNTGRYLCKLNKSTRQLQLKLYDDNVSNLADYYARDIDKITITGNKIYYSHFASFASSTSAMLIYQSAFDFNLNFLYSKIDTTTANESFPDLYQTLDNGFIFKGCCTLSKFDSSLTLIKSYTLSDGMLTDVIEKGNLFIAQNPLQDCQIKELDQSLNVIKNYRFNIYGNINYNYITNHIVSIKDNNASVLSVIDKDTTDEFIMTKFSFTDSSIISQKKITLPQFTNYYVNSQDRIRNFRDKYGYLYLRVDYTNKVTNLSTHGIIRFDSLGHYTPFVITGNIFADQNNNCIKNPTDKNIPQITVTAQNNHSTNFTSSDNFGNYEIGIADTGQIIITAQPNINYPLFAQGNCAVQTSYAYLDSFTIDTINLNLKPTILCPSMYVDISTPMLRRCVSNIYTVNYKNNGTIASPNTYIDVALDRFLTVNSASLAYTNLGNNVLRFNIGNVDYLSSGRFTIDVTVRCDSTIVGQTHCVEAHIYPDTVCAAANYTGPVISASAQCKHDSIEFKLRNSGGNMQNPKRYIVIEDNLNRLNGNYQLNNGQQKIVTIATDSGRTYGIIAEQDDAFPAAIGDKFASAFIEGCNPVNGQFHTGFITQYPEFDGEPYRSVDCQQNRGSFDPNDKTGYPIGVSANHNIEKNTALDYMIRFQNTGNDTAFKVVIVDTISKYLDINTIEPGASSHRYIYMRTDSNTIKFIFDSIKLVDSNKNEKLSHGFVKFRIQQKQNNPNGTKIYNQAEIYFDYNAPIFTNKTMHTIGDVYVRIISKTINPTYSKADVKIYPNPFRDKTTIELQNMELQQTSLILIDITGKEILQQSSDNNQYEINGSDLAKGFYLFRIKNDTTEIATGKIIVQ